MTTEVRMPETDRGVEAAGPTVDLIDDVYCFQGSLSHWAGCWEVHFECAIAWLVDEARELRQRAYEAEREVDKLRELLASWREEDDLGLWRVYRAMWEHSEREVERLREALDIVGVKIVEKHEATGGPAVQIGGMFNTNPDVVDAVRQVLAATEEDDGGE